MGVPIKRKKARDIQSLPWERSKGGCLSNSSSNEGTKKINSLRKKSGAPTTQNVPSPSEHEHDTVAVNYLTYHDLYNILHHKTRPKLTSAADRRCYRKMFVRNHKKKFPRPNFDLDEVRPENESCIGFFNSTGKTPLFSSYTQRYLKPFIWQDNEVLPRRVKLFLELKEKVLAILPNSEDIPNYKKSSINYSYVRPEHIPAMTELAEFSFWNNVKLELALAYPEFTCVATYKKLVVGFGILTPGEHLSEGYLNFLCVRPQWDKCGIGSFMLYHLSQTCLSWDLSLHVSATNPSMLLYQDFGYKTFSFLRGFYDDYLESMNKEDKHSYLMVSESERIL